MFPWDTANFYQIFLHKKRIIHPSESQPYIKKQRKNIDTIDCIDTKFFWYFLSHSSQHIASHSHNLQKNRINE